MVIIPEIKKIFIHIPRTSGTSLSLAISNKFPNCILDLDISHMHDTVVLLKKTFSDYTFFTIMRNPWHIFESTYRLSLYEAETNQYLCNKDSLDIHDHVINNHINIASKPFNANVKSWIKLSQDHPELKPLVCFPGFFSTYCDDSTIVFQYHDNPYEKISQFLGTSLIVGHEHQGKKGSIAWDDETIELIANHCQDDISKFGYKFDL